jgi:hypothetical protein
MTAMLRPRTLPEILVVCIVVCLVAAAAAVPAAACNTPVHRFALYNWESSPYWVVHLHAGAAGAGAAAIERRLAALAEEAPAPNVAFVSVGVDNAEQLEAAPPFVREARERHREEPLPIDLVFNSHGVEIFAGRLSEKDVDGLVDSPARRRLLEQLSASDHALLLFVPGLSGEENARARAEVEKTRALAEKEIGRRAGDLGDAPAPDAAATGGVPAAARGRVEFFELAASESDLWLLRQLHAVEPLEPEEKDGPLVFGIYGRARALEPYIGDGIAAENLLEMVMFMNGPCSCEVKGLNPGVDLVARWDWRRSAEAMARRNGRETGNERYLEDFAILDLEPPPQADSGTPAAASIAAAAPAGASARGAAPGGGSAARLAVKVAVILGLAAAALGWATVSMLRRRG